MKKNFLLYINTITSGIILLLLFLVDRNFPEGILFRVSLHHNPPYVFGTDPSYALATVQGYGIVFMGAISLALLAFLPRKTPNTNTNKNEVLLLILNIIFLAGLVIIGLRAHGQIYSIADSGKTTLVGNYWKETAFVIIGSTVQLVINIVGVIGTKK